MQYVWRPMCHKDTERSSEINALTIAGSDPVSGAGIQADIKTFHAFGLYCASVITSIVIQNTSGVVERMDLSVECVEKQLNVVLSDMDIKTVKIGVIPKKDISFIVRGYVKDFEYVVYDPVLESKNGYKLMDNENLSYIKSEFIKDIFLITPNMREAEILTGRKILTKEDIKETCKVLHDMGAKNVLITGGDLNSVDILYNGSKFFEYRSEKIKKTVHGTGCTFSSAIAANLAKGNTLERSIEISKKYITEGIKNSVKCGKGYEVIDHLYRLKKESERYCVLKDLERAFYMLKNENIYDFIPEVQSNLVFSLKDAENIEDVAGFPGRIIKVDKKIEILGFPDFNASRHMAGLVLTVMKYNREIRSAMNIKYSEEIIKACKNLNYTVSYIDRKNEPEEIRKREGESLKWEIDETFKKTGKIPDVLYDLGDIGKEAMVRVFGKTPEDVAEKIIKIHRLLEEVQ